MYGFLSLRFQYGTGSVAGSTAESDTSRDAVEDFHAFHRIFSCRRLPAQHDGIRLLEDGIGDIRDLRPCRNRILNHAFKHVSSDDDRTTDLETFFDNPTLNDRQFLHLALHAEVAACDHHGIRCHDNVLDESNGILILDFGHRSCTAPVFKKNPLEFQDIGCLATKTQRHKIHIQRNAQSNVGMIFLGQRRQVHLHSWQVDVSLGSEESFRKNFATHTVGIFRQHLHVNNPIVHQHGIANMDVIHQSIIIHIHGVFLLAPRSTDCEFKNLAWLEIELHWQITRADRRTLCIEEDAAVDIQLGCNTTNTFHHIPHPIVLGVTHVEAKNICPR